MRKLLWYVVLSLVGVVLVASEGCSGAAIASSLCNNACLDYNALNCGVQCACAACGTAPPACDTYFECIQSHTSCLGVLGCDSSACGAFVSTNCK